jgi:hypothetical protein
MTATTARTIGLLQLALTIANRAAVADIESECATVHLDDGHRWLDTRPMLDPNEHCNQAIDMAADTLAYAEESGLIRRHAQQRHLVRITSAEA